MIVTLKDRADRLRERLDARLESVQRLLCTEHEQSVVSVTIHDRENGWFESLWVTCCERLEQRAAAILKQRY